MKKRDTLLSYLENYYDRGGETALVWRRGFRMIPWSYRKVWEVAAEWSEELASRQISKGDRVLFCAENSPDWVAAFFGCMLRGAVVVPFDVQSAPEFVLRVQQQVSAKLLLVGALKERPPESIGIPILSVENFSSKHTQTSPGRPLFERMGFRGDSQIQPDDLVEIIFTSGTTATPKGVCLTHRNLLANLIPLEREIEKYLRWERWFHPVRFLNLVPFSHIFGQFMGILVPQLMGGQVYLHNSLNPGEVAEMVRRQSISVVVAVPRMLDILREKIERDWAHAGTLLKSLDAAENQAFLKRVWTFHKIHTQFGWKFWAFVSGGATLNASTEAFWRRLGYAVVQGYGMTETAALISVSHPFKLKQGSIGKSMPGQEVKLNSQGEILVRGDNVSPGIWDGGVKPITDEEGWLHTGDLGAHDRLEHLYFKGRQKDVIVTAAGLNVHPEDLEAALNRQLEVRVSTVIEIEDKLGPEPLAVIIPRDEHADLALAVENANQKLGPHQRIHRWIVWPGRDFPRTVTLKVRKPEVKKWALNKLKSQQEGLALSGQSQGLSELVERIGRITGEKPLCVDRSTRLDTGFKLDSLGRVELLSALEDHYQIELDEAAMSSTATLGDLQDLLQNETTSVTNVALTDSRVSHTDLIQTPASIPPYPYPRWALGTPATCVRTILLQLIVLPITRLLCRASVRGSQHVYRTQRPVVIVANHITHADPALILCALPFHLRKKLSIAMEGERLRAWRHPKPDTGWLKKLVLRLFYVLTVTLFNVFPLPQRSGFRRSFTYAGEAMDRGFSLLIFPEGQHTKDGSLNPFQQGIGLLAAKLNSEILPVKIEGLFEIKQPLTKRRFFIPFVRPGRVSLIFGQPVRFDSNEKPEEITRRLEQIVRDLGAPIAGKM